MRSAFTKVKDWKSIFQSDEHKAFDEKAFSKVFIRHKNSSNWYRQLAKKIDPWLALREFDEAFSTSNARIPWLDESKGFPSVWYWKKGVITTDLNGDRVFPYFHFMGWKKIWATTPEESESSLRGRNFSISESGFD